MALDHLKNKLGEKNDINLMKYDNLFTRFLLIFCRIVLLLCLN